MPFKIHNYKNCKIKSEAVGLVTSQYYHIRICIGNEEPRGAWKILAGFGFNSDSAASPALRAGAFFGGGIDFVRMRCLLDKVRNYFELNPND
jgi:hypothetical protein